MSLPARLKRELKFLKGLSRTLKRVKSIAPDSPNLICDDLEAAVDKWRDSQAIVFEGKSVTYAELDAIANRYAHWAKGQGITRGQTVALFMPNRLEYLAIWYGLSKVGVATALINNQLTGPALAHCLNISQALHCIVDAETSPCFEQVKGLLERHVQQWVLGPAHGDQRDLANALKSCSQLRPDRLTARNGLTAKDTALYIFTSGTTGLPKAARITHMRAQLYMRGFAGSTDARATDRIYVTLPLYHATGGLCAMGAALLNGGAVVLRKKFSVSAFWDDVVAENCTMFVYIGELCRYLANHPETPNEHAHKIRLIFGNGLRPDVWDVMLDRFKVGGVLEFYGATEGNVSLFNFDGRRGAIGRVPGYLRKKFNIRIVKFDVETETPVRGPNGCCIEAAPGEIGECIGHIASDARSNFTGYADKAATEKKILHDVFEKGDAWFRTGDLMRSRRRRLSLFRRPHRRHLPLERRERRHQRGVRAPVGGGRRQGGQCLRRDDRRTGRQGGHGLAGRRAGVRDRRPGRIRRPRAAGLRPPDLRAPAARDRDHRHLQVPQDGPGPGRLRSGPGPRTRCISAIRTRVM
jgi:fatty-acyl-CoA synthase